MEFLVPKSLESNEEVWKDILKITSAHKTG